MAAKAKPRPRRERKKQSHLLDMAPPVLPEVDGAAENYYDSVQERLPYTKAEKEAKESLINVMLANNLVRYEYESDGVTKLVTLADLKNVTVKPKKSAEANGDGE